MTAPLPHIIREQDHGKSHLTATRSEDGKHRPQGINLREGRQQHCLGLLRIKPLRVQKREEKKEREESRRKTGENSLLSCEVGPQRGKQPWRGSGRSCVTGPQAKTSGGKGITSPVWQEGHGGKATGRMFLGLIRAGANLPE